MSYGDFEAVRGIDVDVHRGEIFAFVGPNGAGKTTTVEILEGYRRRSGGEVEVLGVDPASPTQAWRARIGVVLQTCELPPELTVRELLSRYAGYYPAPRSVEETIALVGLEDKRDTRAGRLSGGQERRLDVGLALIGDPELIFLDEPTTGFDPGARHQFWGVIDGLRKLGKTVFLTTHYMDEAEALADRVAVIAAGRIVAEGQTSRLGGRDAAPCEIRFHLPEGLPATELLDLNWVGGCRAGLNGEDSRCLRGAGVVGVAGLGARARHQSHRPRGRATESRGRLSRSGAPVMTAAQLTFKEFGYERKRFWRDPQAVFATVTLPLLYLIILVTNFGNDKIAVAGQPGRMKESVYLVGTIVAIAIISAAFFDLMTGLVRERERGILKRQRSTPLPTSVYIAGRVANAVLLVMLTTVVLIVLGRVLYGVALPSTRIAALILAVAVAAIAFACMAFAFTLLVRKENAAMPLGLGAMLTLFFLSGNFFNINNDTMRTIANVFPVKHLNTALVTVFNPHTAGAGIKSWDLAVIAIWGLASLLIAIRFFRWTPASD